jgi:hypothetical protein
MARSRDRAGRAPATAKPRADIYTALLVVALLAQVAGSVFLYFDYDRLKTSSPPSVKSDLPPASAATSNPPPPAPVPAPAPGAP